MINISTKSKCCGCYGCINVCPKQCIDMNIDNEGFWYPEVDKEKCIDCNLCEKVCPVINVLKNKKFDIKAYACKNKNEKIRLTSSSGGVFTSLCECVINQNGVVFGAAFNLSFEVEHMQAKTIEECEKFKGSKYVQSKIGDTYKEAKTYLDEDRIVLFSGTQCQIKGLNLFLRKEYKNLIVVDIICHGVPSPLVFNMYKENLKKQYNSDIEYIGFREKNKGWKEFSYTTKFKNGKNYNKTLKEDIFMKGFLKDLYLRPSCYNCEAKNFKSNSDISLADYWGVENKHPEMDDDRGVSLILVNSKKGQDIFDKIGKNLEIIETDLEYAILNNPCIVRPVKQNVKRDAFFNEVQTENIDVIIEKYTKLTVKEKIKGTVYELLYKGKRIIKNIK